jgi:GNAT superfamily N-acetyltransferase
MTTTMRIERVSDTGGNLEAATSLIDAAGEWLRTKDTDQWAEPWPSRKERDERVRRDLAAGKTWFIRDEDAGDALAATVTVAKDPISFVWRDSEANLAEPAVYVHRLVTARRYAGLGLGAQLIDWAGRRGHTFYGARWIRIDVWTTNTDLHHYYKMQRFEPCGLCADLSYRSRALFQKSFEDIEASAIPHVMGDAAEFVLPCHALSI